MANILINNFCNLRCSYCFAEDIIQQNKYAITKEQLEKILSYFQYEGCQLALIGGEPTIHPQFLDIYKQYMEHINQYRGMSKIFTNATNLEPYLSEIQNETAILINVNRDDEEAYQKLVRCFDKIKSMGKENVTLGINISPDRTNYSFFWDLVEKYKEKNVRFSVVTPGGCLTKYLADKEAYYEKMKPIFLDFCKKAIELEVKANPDCAQIPTCYFTEEELKTVQSASPMYMDRKCKMVGDIEPDGTTSWCFGSGMKYNLFHYKDIDEMAMAVKSDIDALRKKNYTDRCEDCFKKGRMCNGGCMSFAK